MRALKCTGCAPEEIGENPIQTYPTEIWAKSF